MHFLNLWISFRPSIFATLFAMLLSVSWNPSFAIAEDFAATNIEQSLRPLNIEDSPERMAETIRKVFRNCDDNLIAHLCRHPDTSTSLFAAWEKTKRRSLAAHLLQDSMSKKQETDRSMAWFTGFVEGRLKTDPSGWWQRTVERGIFEYEKGLETGQDFIIGLTIEVPDSPLILAAPGVLTHFPTTMSMVDGRVVVRHEDFKISVPRKFIDQVADGQEIPGNVIMMVSRVDANSSVVVIHGTLSTDACLIALIAIDSNKVIWKRKVQVIAKLGGGHTGTGPWHRMTVQCDFDRIVLFGAGPFGIYVTGFVKENGKRLFAFFSYDE